MAWFPVLPAERAAPVRPGPLPEGRPGPAPVQHVNVKYFRNENRPPYSRTRPGRRRGHGRQRLTQPGAAVGQPGQPGWMSRPRPAAEAAAASALLSAVNALPAGQVHAYPDSNAWAANGPAVAGGRSMLAGDPHLPQTIPSIWYQVALSAPGYAVSGVSVPGPARRPPRPQPAHRLVPHRHPEPGHAVLHRADQQVPARAVLLGRRVAADAPGALHDRGPGRRRAAADGGPDRARPGHDPGRADHLGGLDGQCPLTRPGRPAGHQYRARLGPVPRGAGGLAGALAELRVRRRPGPHRRDLGRVLPGGPPRPALAADAGHRRGRRGRGYPVRGGPAGLRPAGARAGHGQPAPGRRRRTRTTSGPPPTSSTRATGPARSTRRCRLAGGWAATG